MKTRETIQAEIKKLSGPCHEAFRPGRELKIVSLRAMLSTAPTDAQVAADLAWQAEHAKTDAMLSQCQGGDRFDRR